MSETALKKLPSINDLYADPESVKHNQLNALLNVEPKKEWIKDHPFAKGVKYLPIERVEFLLTMIYLRWRVEVKETQLMANSVVVSVRLHVKDPITGEWDYHDGIGACPIQTDAGAAATDFTKVKNDAVMKAAPAAESYAIKDAAEKFGKIFGKDLNRKDVIGYSVLLSRDLENGGIPNYEEEIDAINSLEELRTYWAANKGKGADFDKYIAQRMDILESQQ